jgi:hypothetical protein
MRAISSENQTALNQGNLIPRDFLWIVARNRETSDPESVGFWSDIENATVLVIDPETLLPVYRNYYAAGGLVEISEIPAVSVIQVQDIEIKLSQLDELVEQAIRLYDIKQAKVEIHRGLFDPETRNLVAPAFVRFVGFVNNLRITTAAEGSDGGVFLSCVSHTQELTRANPATRSNEDQKLRNPTDAFFVDTSTVGEQELDWGQVNGKQKTQVQERKGLFGWGNFLGFL